MGITNVQDLVDDGKPVSPEELDAHREALAAEARESFETRAEVEMDFATNRERIDAQYAEAVAKAIDRRDKAHAKNLDKRTNALEKVGLNPNGSDPRGRAQGTL